ncbi:unnamed protein product, partial [marine sediment metagenome]
LSEFETSSKNIPDSVDMESTSSDEKKEKDTRLTPTMANIYAKQGHYDKAIAILEEITAKEPDNEEALSLLEEYKIERDARMEQDETGDKE